MTKYPNGTVLKMLRNGKSEHWKITESRASIIAQDRFSYQCIRCSPTGKEFRDMNGFGEQWVSDEVSKGNIRILMNSAVGVKANIDEGIESGVKKRRIEYLKQSIAAMTSELARLEFGV